MLCLSVQPPCRIGSSGLLLLTHTTMSEVFKISWCRCGAPIRTPELSTAPAPAQDSCARNASTRDQTFLRALWAAKPVNHDDWSITRSTESAG